MFRDLSPECAALVSAWVVGPLGMKGPNCIIFAVVLLQAAVSTGHVVVLVVRMVREFVSVASTPGETLAYLQNDALPEHVAQEAFYLLNSQIGDWFLVWRVYVVWNRNIRLCAPFYVLTRIAVCGCIGLVSLSHLGPTDTVFVDGTSLWFLVSVILSLAVQCSGTFLIAWRAWSTPTIVRQTNTTRCDLVWILCALVDSGFLYMSTTFFVLAFVSRQLNAGAVLSAMLGQISATVPLTIVIRECWKASRAESRLSGSQCTLVVDNSAEQRRSRPNGFVAAEDRTVLMNLMRRDMHPKSDFLESAKKKAFSVYPSGQSF
ncbi:hypothetical protein OF83DRAFT_609605 [Amylostereum chailletii]|nr:hypothetical protein OF83DRAFT_609605 [Amylostereum chailletii]